MRNPLKPFLDAKPVVILDGALATELERRGGDLDDPLWSAKLLLEAPDRIEEVHFDYLRAGADVVTSSSYQATLPGFAARGIEPSEAERLLELSVTLARDARERFWSADTGPGDRLCPLVAASIGCYGAFLHDGSEYRGNYGLSRQELIGFHERRFEILAHAGADLLAFETIPSLVEAEALARLLQAEPGTPAWLSFSCRNGREISSGEPFAEAVALADDVEGIIAVGVNCTPPSYLSELLARARERTQKPLVAYPNSGEAWDAERHCWLPAPSSSSRASLVELAPEWHRLGARLVGGCCRTTPDDTAALARRFSNEAQSNRL